MRSKKKPEHYVDNKEFLAALSEYKRNVQDALTEEAPRPMIPNYIGECFLKIAQHLSYRPNFINYPFREDMISDGIENCVSYIHNFDPEKSNNPFAYFTQIIYYAFLRRIQKEKKQLYIKHKSLEQSVLFNSLVEGDDKGIGNNVEIGSDYMNDFVKNFEAKEVKTKEKRKQAKGVEKYF